LEEEKTMAMNTFSTSATVSIDAIAASIVRRTELSGDTVAKKFVSAVALRGDSVALRQKEYGVWREMSWRELGEQVRYIALGLVALDFQPGDVAAILSNTRWEWSAADYAILLAGGVCCGIYPTDAAGQVQYLCADSKTQVLFVEDDEQLDKALSVRDKLPQLKTIVVIDMEGLHELSDTRVVSLTQLMASGRAYEARQPGALGQRLTSRQPQDLAILVYTSGTTGKPKGAMLSHHNLCFVMETFAPALTQGPDDDKMAFLPLCHVVERVAGQLLSLQTGSRLNYVENPETVIDNLREIAPTALLAVPRIWEKLYSLSSLAVKDASSLQNWAYALALRIGTDAAMCQEENRPVSIWLNVKWWLARALVLNNTRRFLGLHRVRWAITGAAPISPNVIRWYRALGLTLLEGYGMTESTGGGTLNTPGAARIGSVGQAQALNQIQLGEHDEILIRGDNIFMGYLNNPEQTAQAVDADGWLHTGDVGRIDADGFVSIVDRMKDIIITAGGKNITPSEFESELKFSSYISDVVVIGDKRPYLTCLVMIDHENVEKYAQDRQLAFTNFTSLARSKEVLALIESEINKVNQKFAQVEQVKKFRLLEIQLTAEDEELTPTLKLKRKLVNTKYSELIEGMYR
jgi:long-chain acyl-CoA synthetase